MVDDEKSKHAPTVEAVMRLVAARDDLIRRLGADQLIAQAATWHRVAQRLNDSALAQQAFYDDVARRLSVNAMNALAQQTALYGDMVRRLNTGALAQQAVAYEGLVRRLNTNALAQQATAYEDLVRRFSTDVLALRVTAYEAAAVDQSDSTTLFPSEWTVNSLAYENLHRVSTQAGTLGDAAGPTPDPAATENLLAALGSALGEGEPDERYAAIADAWNVLAEGVDVAALWEFIERIGSQDVGDVLEALGTRLRGGKSEAPDLYVRLLRGLFADSPGIREGCLSALSECGGPALLGVIERAAEVEEIGYLRAALMRLAKRWSRTNDRDGIQEVATGGYILLEQQLVESASSVS